MDIFDFAEDWLCEGEPTCHLSANSRTRRVTLEVQNRVSRQLDSSTLPSKDSEIRNCGFRELFLRPKQN